MKTRKPVTVETNTVRVTVELTAFLRTRLDCLIKVIEGREF